jgi:hypothetical protein
LKYGQIHKQIFTEILIEFKSKRTDKEKDVFRQVDREKDRRKYRQKDIHRESDGMKDRQVYRLGMVICVTIFIKTDRQRDKVTHMDIWTVYGRMDRQTERWTLKDR